MVMADCQDMMLKTAISTENLLPVELTIHDHYGRETWCALHKLPVIVGRDEHAGVPLADPWVSHSHCEISQMGDVLVVRDLDSKNGIFVHHHRVSESHVLSGERLTVGRTEIVVRYRGRAQTAMEVEFNERQRPSRDCAPETVELLY
jgi:pSer/pThr/pTyr-binding forkhead associated (FHA) protein